MEFRENEYICKRCKELFYNDNSNSLNIVKSSFIDHEGGDKENHDFILCDKCYSEFFDFILGLDKILWEN